LTFLVVVIAGCLGAVALPPVRETVHGWFTRKSDSSAPESALLKKAWELIELDGKLGLRVNAEAIKATEIKSVEVKPALEPRPLPSQAGLVQYDSEHLFPIRARFPGEIGEFLKVIESTGPTQYRPIRFGDRVKQGDVLAVIWSKDLGEKKAALVDAIVNLELSQDNLNRQNEAFKSASISVATVRASENQVAKDKNAVQTAESTLLMWKVPKEDIEKIKEEAKRLKDEKKARNPDQEKHWARIEVPVPRFCDDPNRELVIVTKDTNQGDMVDPSREPPLFRLADLSRLQVWVYPPAEYLPRIREQLDRGRNIKWLVRFLDDPPDTRPASWT
jgi:cobalt-zinc-cadmium efflux system membrane fusion protein